MTIAGTNAITELWAKCKAFFAPSSHTHTESDITDLGNYLPTSGGTMSGDLCMDDNDLTYGETGTQISDELGYGSGITDYALSHYPVVGSIIKVHCYLLIEPEDDVSVFNFTSGTSEKRIIHFGIVHDSYTDYSIDYDGVRRFEIQDVGGAFDEVSFYQFEYEQDSEISYPTFTRDSWSTASDQTTLPVTPCFVFNTTMKTLYWCDGTDIVPAAVPAYGTEGSTMSGSDLDDQGIGEAWWGNNFTNAPEGHTDFHLVTRQRGMQTAYRYVARASAPQMYLRSYVNDVWQPWVRVDAANSLPLSGGTLTGDLKYGLDTAYPTFTRASWSTSSDESTLPTTPCFVLDTTSFGLYWCDGS